MKRKLLLAFCFCFLSIAASSVLAQDSYNEKNITQDVATWYYDDLRPLRAMEYSTDPAGTIIQRRLEILPENDLPAVKIRVINEFFEEIPFINQPPFDESFGDGLFGSKYSTEAATLLVGTEATMKVLKDKFGWLGLDNQAVNGKPIIWNIMSPNKPSMIAAPQYSLISHEFTYLTTGSEPDQLVNVDAVAHEIVHGIIDAKIGYGLSYGIDPCSERKVVGEALADIIGLYVVNEYEQNSPALYTWRFSKGYLFPGRSFDNPSAIGQPATYFGSYYANSCPESSGFDEHQNATVINHWYYLLANGTTGTETNDLGYSYKFNGIGIEKAIQIVWKCLDKLNKYTDFNDLKKASLEVTEQLYGLHSTEYLVVMDAWCAVGICENNLGPFSMSPAHGTTGVEPWPGVNVNVTWEGLLVDEWEVQFATNTAFTENVQNVTIKNFNVVLKPGGGSAYSGFATGYYLPGERVYARARITKAGPNFCKGYNPLCVLYQQYGPAHAFTQGDKQAKFWHATPGYSWIVNPWNDPSISWKSIGNAEQYVYEVAEDNAFSKIIFTGTTPFSGNFSESGTINAPLQPDKGYYTRVRARRFNTLKLTNNNGAWSETEVINVVTPRTSVLQASNQEPGDAATEVGSLGFWVGWHPFPGSTLYIIQIATDDAFQNIIRTKTVAGNLSTALVELPSLPDGSYLSVRVLPQNGSEFGLCDKAWRVKTKAATAAPLMKSPADGTAFAFHAFLGTFEWKANTLNMNLVHHFEVHFKKKTSGVNAVFPTQDIQFSMSLVDASLFTNKPGFEVAVLAVGPLGAKSALSPPFSYPICPDHPEVIFPIDQITKVDASQDFSFKWLDSFWFDPGSQYLVTIFKGVTPLAGFKDKPTTGTQMLVPAGTLTNGETYSVTVRNSASCPATNVFGYVFSTVGSGGSNQPQPPKLVDFTIELKGFRNDPDLASFPPAYGTSNFELGIELIDPNGIPLLLSDPNGMQVTKLQVDSENSGVILLGNNKPQGKYKLRLNMSKIFPPDTYYPFDQPRYSVFLNGKPVVDPHIITANFLDPGSIFHEWNPGFQFADIILDVK